MNFNYYLLNLANSMRVVAVVIVTAAAALEMSFESRLEFRHTEAPAAAQENKSNQSDADKEGDIDAL